MQAPAAIASDDPARGVADRVLEALDAGELHLEARPGPRAGEALERLGEPGQAHFELLPLVGEPLRVGTLATRRPRRSRKRYVAGDRERVERRVELGGRELHLRERLAGERERRRAGGRRGARRSRSAPAASARAGCPSATTSRNRSMSPPRSTLEGPRGRCRRAGPRRPAMSSTSARNAASLLPERHEHEQECSRVLGVDLADHPEVEEVDPVVPPLHVARVRVGVEEAHGQDLAVVATRGAAAPPPLRAAPSGASRIGHALDLLHDEQPRRRELLVDAGHGEARVRREDLAHPLDVRRLLAEVELAAQRRRTGAR